MPKQINRKPGAYPEPGDVLEHRFREGKRAVRAKVVESNAVTGAVKVEIRGKTYESLSAAAQKFSGHPANGWVWWGLQKTHQEARKERQVKATAA